METILVFRQEGNQLDVSEINDFGKDLLDCCDGKTTLREICHRLHGPYGKGLKDEEFYGFCIEALRSLGEMNLVQSGEAKC